MKSNLTALLLLAFVTTAHAAPKKRTKISGEAAEVSGGADDVEGWIYKKDKDGHTIKVPRKQTFKFGGAKVEGAVTRPAESALAARTTPANTSLIPVRKTFRRDFMQSAGAPGSASSGNNSNSSGDSNR